MSYICPVCGYNQLRYPPEDYTICPSCGTEFGYHDFTKSHEQLRNLWFANKAKWHSTVIPEPENWNPYLQLMNLQSKVKVNSEFLTKDLTDDFNIEVEEIGKRVKFEKDRRIESSLNLIIGQSRSVQVVRA